MKHHLRLNQSGDIMFCSQTLCSQKKSWSLQVGSLLCIKPVACVVCFFFHGEVNQCAKSKTANQSSKVGIIKTTTTKTSSGKCSVIGVLRQVPPQMKPGGTDRLYQERSSGVIPCPHLLPDRTPLPYRLLQGQRALLFRISHVGHELRKYIFIDFSLYQFQTPCFQKESWRHLIRLVTTDGILRSLSVSNEQADRNLKMKPVTQCC